MLDAPEYSGVYRPVINEQDKLNQTHSELIHTSAEDLNSSISADPESFLEVFIIMYFIKHAMQNKYWNQQSVCAEGLIPQ